MMDGKEESREMDRVLFFDINNETPTYTHYINV